MDDIIRRASKPPRAIYIVELHLAECNVVNASCYCGTCQKLFQFVDLHDILNSEASLFVELL